PEAVRKILIALGCLEQSSDSAEIITIPPSWRRDLEREIDLVEEVARVHGYDKIPEDASVPMAASHRPDGDRRCGTMVGSIQPVDGRAAAGSKFADVGRGGSTAAEPCAELTGSAAG